MDAWDDDYVVKQHMLTWMQEKEDPDGANGWYEQTEITNIENICVQLDKLQKQNAVARDEWEQQSDWHKERWGFKAPNTDFEIREIIPYKDSEQLIGDSIDTFARAYLEYKAKRQEAKALKEQQATEARKAKFKELQTEFGGEA